MAKQATITEIAKRAGVSIGTVDRVIHHRGGVSTESRQKVQAILDEVGYKVNLHTSAVALRKTFRIAVVVPQSGPGEYWDGILKGIRDAVKEYSDIPISLELLPYDQFDQASCLAVYDKIPDLEADAVILGPTLVAPSQALCAAMEARRLPYVFVDTTLPGAHPLAAFTADQPSGGALAGKLLQSIVPAEKSIALVLPRLNLGGKVQNTEQRRSGFLRYFADSAPGRVILETEMDFLARDDEALRRFLRSHPETGGICVLNSRGSVIADALRRDSRGDLFIVAFDLTDENVRCLCEGSIFALVCQRPERQGFQAVTTLLEHLLYHRDPDNTHILMPLDIVVRENLDYYD